MGDFFHQIDGYYIKREEEYPDWGGGTQHNNESPYDPSPLLATTMRPTQAGRKTRSVDEGVHGAFDLMRQRSPSPVESFPPVASQPTTITTTTAATADADADSSDVDGI